MSGPSDIPLLQVVLAFAVVLALIGGLGAGLKYASMRGFILPSQAGRTRRLKIVESLPLDAKRRCVIIRCDEGEHLLLLGPQGDIVIEANLSPPPVQRNS